MEREKLSGPVTTGILTALFETTLYKNTEYMTKSLRQQHSYALHAVQRSNHKGVQFTRQRNVNVERRKSSSKTLEADLNELTVSRFSFKISTHHGPSFTGTKPFRYTFNAASSKSPILD